MFSLLATAVTTASSGDTLTDQVVSKVNAFQRYWDGIGWDA
ncbi:mechanosensitive ion channel family protein, partial [Enterococcus faecium]|nr:mechanosensitive ion channel family protein [Enterococcus faecium]